MWLFMFNMTPVTVYLRLALRSNTSFRIASGCTAAPGFNDSGTGDWNQKCCSICCFDFSFTPVLFKNQAPVCTLTSWKWTTAE